MLGVCYGVCFLLSDSCVADIATNGCSAFEFALLNHLEYMLAGICASWCWFVAHSGGVLSSCSWLLSVGSPNPNVTETAVLQPFNQYCTIYSFRNLPERHLILHFPWMVRRNLLFQVWYHLMTGLTLNLWWASNPVILVWWIGIRLMNLLKHGWHNVLLLNHKFIPGL